jgi:MOSC domain-containing protein YiiM
MKILSVNVGQPREVLDAAGNRVLTSIYKSPVDGSVPVRGINIDGDRQADLVKHGGPLRAVYMYPSEHYPFWRGELPGKELPWGAFGENLTIEGLLEDDVRIGDRLRAGSAELVVTRPRKPCYKLAIRLAQKDMVARFRASGRSGFYLRIAQEGELRTGDAITRLARGSGPTVREVFEDYTAMQTRITLPRPAEDEFNPVFAKYITRVADLADAGRALEVQREDVLVRLSSLAAERASFRYAPDKWSVTEVIGHLADVERVFAYRLLRIARGDETPLAPFDDQSYVRLAAFERRPFSDVLDEWAAARKATLLLVRGLPSEAWARRGTASSHSISTRAIVYIMLGHVEHHLALLADRYGVGVPSSAPNRP